MVTLADMSGSPTTGPAQGSARSACAAAPASSPIPTPAPTLHEVIVPRSADAGHWGLVAGLLAGIRPGRVILWVQDALSARETGSPHARGLALRGIDPSRIVLVRAPSALEAARAMEAGLACRAVGAVVGETYGEQPDLGFTATRRLAYAAEGRGTPCILVRSQCPARTSGARRRWVVASRPSSPDPFDDRAPGGPRWRIELVRAKARAPGAWDAGGDALPAILADPVEADEPAGTSPGKAEAGSLVRIGGSRGGAACLEPSPGAKERVAALRALLGRVERGDPAAWGDPGAQAGAAESTRTGDIGGAGRIGPPVRPSGSKARGAPRSDAGRSAWLPEARVG